MAHPPPSRFILASASPRRRELLGSLGLSFEVLPTEAEEAILPGEEPAEAARRLALAKARLAALARPGAVVLGADTVVVFEGRLLGKPASPEEARQMLRALHDRPHEVITGLAAVRDGVERPTAVCTRVIMRDYTAEEIEAYIARGLAGLQALGHTAPPPADDYLIQWHRAGPTGYRALHK